MRELNGHRVWGKEITVNASNEELARIAIRKVTSDHIWEIKEIAPNKWEGYCSDDAWALND